MQITPHFTLQILNQDRNGYSDEWLWEKLKTEGSIQICTFNHVSLLLCRPAYVITRHVPQTDFSTAETDSWCYLRPGALWKTRHPSHPLFDRPCTPPSPPLNLPLPTSPSCLSLIKVKVVQGLLMLQTVAQVLATPRSRNSLPQTEVTLPLSQSLFLSIIHSLFLPKCFFSINRGSQLKLAFNFLPNPY